MINSISDLGKYNSVSTRKNDSSEDQIKVLRSQEASIQKQIDSIKNGSMDVKTKQQLVEPLQEQIQSIEAQIQQIQISQVNDDGSSKVKNKKQSISDASVSDGEDRGKLVRDALFLNVSSVYDQLKNISSIRKELMGKSDILKSDAHLDDMTENYAMAKKERAESASTLGKANGIQAKIGKLNHDVSAKSKSLKDDSPDNETKKLDEFA